jgi:uncharacterized protein YjlB
MTNPQRIYLKKGSDVPNNPLLPVLLFRHVIDPRASKKAETFEKKFKDNGWLGAWRDKIFDYLHFHSNAHEALGIAKGSAEIELGGEDGKTVTLRAGDMIILPAGTGHRRLNASSDLLVVGAYPEGQADYDIQTSGKKTPHVELPKADPFFGPRGPLMRLWTRNRRDLAQGHAP